MEAIKRIAHFGPLMFAVGFMTPLIAQVFTRMEWTVPFGLSPIVFGLIVALGFGVPAQIRGRWL